MIGKDNRRKDLNASASLFASQWHTQWRALAQNTQRASHEPHGPHGPHGPQSGRH